MNRTNLVTGLLFLAAGVYLAASSFALPPGTADLPGPGFFPRGVGIAMAALAAALLLQPSDAPFRVENAGAILGAVALTVLYLLLWGTGLFAVRTAVFLVLLLKLFGEKWKPSVIVSVILTAAVTLAFGAGLRLTLE